MAGPTQPVEITPAENHSPGRAGELLGVDMDYTLCKDTECPLRKRCYRYRAKPGEWQSWFTLSPRRGTTCEYFMEMKYD